MKVSELMNADIAVVYGGDTIQKVSEVMAKKGRGLLPVLNNDEERKVIGVVSNKDIINKVISKKLSPENVFVADVMIKDVISVKPDAATADVMYLMQRYNIKRVLVIEEDVLHGIISSNDILKAMIKYKKQLLEMAIDF